MVNQEEINQQGEMKKRIAVLHVNGKEKTKDICQKAKVKDLFRCQGDSVLSLDQKYHQGQNTRKQDKVK